MNNEVRNGNRKIAEFMGGKGKLIHTSTEVFVFPNGDMIKLARLNYHKHWNLIIPVCKKMLSIKNDTKVIGSSVSARWYYSVSDLQLELQNLDITRIYNVLIKSIDKYNETKL